MRKIKAGKGRVVRAGVGVQHGLWHAWGAPDGLSSSMIWAILQDREGYLWFGTEEGGVIRYDGEQFGTFTTADGLARDTVTAIVEDRRGRLWFGTGDLHRRIGEGVSCYDGEIFTTLTTADGLAHNAVAAICEDRAGNLWFGTLGGGVSRYDGTTLTTLTTADGLAHNTVLAVAEDSAGRLWFGTYGGGVSRYDGATFTTFTTRDGLACDAVQTIREDRAGRLWFGTEDFRKRTGGGVSCYDGVTFTTLTTADGLAFNGVTAILEDRMGYIWFGTFGGGVSRYDGTTFATFTSQNGLASNLIRSIWEDQAGHLWFGTRGGGVSRYDGTAFQNLTAYDGLPHSTANYVLQDRDGVTWIATEGGGVVRYRPSLAPPVIRLTNIVADRRHAPAPDVVVPSSQHLVAFEFHGLSLTTRPGQLVYVYRLEGVDQDWRQTRERRVEYANLSEGEYRFRVKAVDRDLNYSEEVQVRLTAKPDPRIVGLTEALRAGGAPGEFVGSSPVLQQLLTHIQDVAQTDLTVLIQGETGTGKGLVARAIHGASARRDGPFIQVNCGAIPEGLVESELLGHEKGAFTGAVARKLGRVELAEGGTLFLDEIGDLASAAQAKLLRVLEERVFERVGGTVTLGANARVMAATNRDLEKMVVDGHFRDDLYYRLQAYVIRVPPLRERLEDIPLLVSYFAERFAQHLNRPIPRAEPAAMKLLQEHNWPGNVRELEHLVQRAVLAGRNLAIGVDEIAAILPGRGGQRPSGRRTFLPLEEYERQYLAEVLEATEWVVYGPRGAAQVLGIHPEKLRYRLKQYGLRRPDG